MAIKTTVVPRPLSNDPRFTQCIHRYSRASKRFVEVYMYIAQECYEMEEAHKHICSLQAS